MGGGYHGGGGGNAERRRIYRDNRTSCAVYFDGPRGAMMSASTPVYDMKVDEIARGARLRPRIFIPWQNTFSCRAELHDFQYGELRQSLQPRRGELWHKQA